MIPGAPAPGPASLDKVFLRKYGPRNARTILILTPGSPGGQGNYAALAPALVERVRGLAVWAVDRRGNMLEDVSAFGRKNPDDALRYYFLGEEVGGKRFNPLSDQEGSYVREWGATVALNDLRTVVLAARAGGRRKVILGGHSAGAVTVPTYAAWDFNGQPGYRGLAGLLAIDGMQFGAFDAFVKGTSYAPKWNTVAQARAGLAEAATQSPFGIAGAQMPVPLWVIGAATELACEYALKEPQAPSALLSPIPASMRPLLELAGFPSERITNEAFFGVLTTSGIVDVLNMRTGRLAPQGDPRRWISGPDSSVRRVCGTFAQEPGNGLEWYYPARLDRELLQALPNLRPTPATRFLGLRPFHLSEVDTPLYVFQTAISKGGVLRGARRFVRSSKIRDYRSASDPQMGHFDPLEDFPARNKFIRTVVPFLRDIVEDGT